MSVKIEKYIYRNRVEDNFYMIKVFKEEERIVRVKEEISKDIAKKSDKPVYGFRILGLVDELLKLKNDKAALL